MLKTTITYTMATYPSNKERTNYARICRAIIDLSSDVMRNVLSRQVKPVQVKNIIMRCAKIDKKLKAYQWACINNAAKVGSYKEFDITLLCNVIRLLSVRDLRNTLQSQIQPSNIRTAVQNCKPLATKLTSEELNQVQNAAKNSTYDKCNGELLWTLYNHLFPSTYPNIHPTMPWGIIKMPDPSNTTLGDDIERIRVLRNTVYAHFTTTEIGDHDFNVHWSCLEGVMTRLDQRFPGTRYKKNLDDIKDIPMDEDEEKFYCGEMEKLAENEKLTSEKVAECNLKIDNLRKTILEKFEESDTKIVNLSKTSAKQLNESIAKIDRLSKTTSEQLEESNTKLDNLSKTTAEQLKEGKFQIDNLFKTLSEKFEESNTKIANLSKIIDEQFKSNNIQIDNLSKCTAKQFEQINTKVDNLFKMTNERRLEIQTKLEKHAKMMTEQSREINTKIDNLSKITSEQFEKINHKIDCLSKTTTECKMGIKDLYKISDEERNLPKLVRTSIENTLALINEHKKDSTFYIRKSVQLGVEILKEEGILILTGKGGEGKTKCSLEIMKQIYEEDQGYIVLDIESIDKWDELVSADRKTLVRLDDPIGKSNTDFVLYQKCERFWDKIYACVKSGKTKVILTIRKNILKENRLELQRYRLFDKCHKVNLSKYDNGFREKWEIFQSHCRQNNIEICSYRKDENFESKAVLSKTVTVRICEDRVNFNILEVDPLIGFPQACYLFCKNRTYTRLGPSFFQHPNESLIKALKSMRRSTDNKEKMRYCIMSYMILNGGVVDFENIDHDKLNKVKESIGLNETFKDYQYEDNIEDIVDLYVGKKFPESSYKSMGLKGMQESKFSVSMIGKDFKRDEYGCTLFPYFSDNEWFLSVSLGFNVNLDGPFGRFQHNLYMPFGRTDHNLDMPFGRAEHNLDMPFGRTEHNLDMPFGRAEHNLDMPFGRTEHNLDMPFGRTDHNLDMHFGRAEHSLDMPFGRTEHNLDMPFGRAEHNLDMPFGRTEHNLDMPFGRAEHNLDMPFGRAEHNIDMPFGRTEHNLDMPFGRAEHNLDMPFGRTEHNLDMPFGRTEHNLDMPFGRTEHNLDMPFGRTEHNLDMPFGRTEHIDRLDDDLEPLTDDKESEFDKLSQETIITATAVMTAVKLCRYSNDFSHETFKAAFELSRHSYFFSHETIKAAVAIAFSECNIELFLELCPWQLINEFVRPNIYESKKGEVVINMKSAHYQYLIQRLSIEIKNSKFDWLLHPVFLTTDDFCKHLVKSDTFMSSIRTHLEEVFLTACETGSTKVLDWMWGNFKDDLILIDLSHLLERFVSDRIPREVPLSVVTWMLETVTELKYDIVIKSVIGSMKKDRTGEQSTANNIISAILKSEEYTRIVSNNCAANSDIFSVAIVYDRRHWLDILWKHFKTDLQSRDIEEILQNILKLKNDRKYSILDSSQEPLLGISWVMKNMNISDQTFTEKVLCFLSNNYLDFYDASSISEFVHILANRSVKDECIQDFFTYAIRKNDGILIENLWKKFKPILSSLNLASDLFKMAHSLGGLDSLVWFLQNVPGISIKDVEQALIYIVGCDNTSCFTELNNLLDKYKQLVADSCSKCDGMFIEACKWCNTKSMDILWNRFQTFVLSGDISEQIVFLCKCQKQETGVLDIFKNSPYINITSAVWLLEHIPEWYLTDDAIEGLLLCSISISYTKFGDARTDLIRLILKSERFKHVTKHSCENPNGLFFWACRFDDVVLMTQLWEDFQPSIIKCNYSDFLIKNHTYMKVLEAERDERNGVSLRADVMVWFLERVGSVNLSDDAIKSAIHRCMETLGECRKHSPCRRYGTELSSQFVTAIQSSEQVWNIVAQSCQEQDWIWKMAVALRLENIQKILLEHFP